MLILLVAVAVAVVGTTDAFVHSMKYGHDRMPVLARAAVPSSLFRMSAAKRKFVIGTRGSPLAQAQAHETKRLLEEQFSELDIDIRDIVTKGDAVLSSALSEIGGKGLFTKELDTYLLDKTVDICVHSMKDVPTQLPDGTTLACYLPREETHDVFISHKYKSLSELPDGSTIGSASLRRQAQLLAINPTWNVINFRGNVQTRLNKLKHGVVDGTLLALAGLKRLGMRDLVEESQIIPSETLLPAVSQGAIGIQCRSDDKAAIRYLSKLNDKPTELAVECERGFLEALDGNCRTPIAAQAVFASDGSLHLKGMISMCDGTNKLVITKSVPACTCVEDARSLGAAAGNEIIRQAGPVMMQAYHDSMFECSKKCS